MIGKLTGILSDKNPPEVVVDCHGVGYEVNVPMSTFYNLPGLGDTITVTVTDVYPNGNLLVSGEKQVGINHASEFIRFSGVVNPVRWQ